MCGLVGYLGRGSVDDLHAMSALLRHRGPDDNGFWQQHDVGLAHRRLSLIDCSEAGAQPMHFEHASLVFNGELYNAPDLRLELEALGHVFVGHSDTEVLLHAYRAWGVDCLQRLSGMFACAIYDQSSGALHLWRDPLGIKPLFYAHHAHGLVFGSELKAVLAHASIGRSIHRPAIDQYLALGYVPAPLTMFEQVRALQPGHAIYYCSGKLEIHAYWQPPKEPQSMHQYSETDLIDELDQRLQQAVASHLLADVELGAFVSGGVDSSLIAAIAQRQLDRPLKTYTIGFDEGVDERAQARIVAEHIGSQHTEALAKEDLARYLPEMLYHLDQPLFDNSILPTYLVSKCAARDVKAVLSGDGGDEPFFGYDWTRWALRLPRLLPAYSPTSWQWAYQRGLIGQLKRLAYDVSHTADARYIRRLTSDSAFRHFLYRPEYSAELAGLDGLEVLQDGLAKVSGDQRFAMCDMQHYLPDDVLFKVDRMSMAHGLEVRVPLLDRSLIEWTMRLPVDLRFRSGRGKFLLRKVAARYLPQSILSPSKQGFSAPMEQWLHGSLGDEVADLFASDRFAQRGFIDPVKAQYLLKLHRSGSHQLSHRIWSLVVLEHWFRVWIDDQGVDHIV